jgi:hypothetical protein
MLTLPGSHSGKPKSTIVSHRTFVSPFNPPCLRWRHVLELTARAPLPFTSPAKPNHVSLSCSPEQGRLPRDIVFRTCHMDLCPIVSRVSALFHTLWALGLCPAARACLTSLIVLSLAQGKEPFVSAVARPLCRLSAVLWLERGCPDFLVWDATAQNFEDCRPYPALHLAIVAGKSLEGYVSGCAVYTMAVLHLPAAMGPTTVQCPE